MARAGLSFAAAGLTLLLVVLLPWREGGVLLQEQSRAAAGVAAALGLLVVAGGGRVGGGLAPVFLLSAAGYAVWHWVSGTSADGASSREAAGQLAGAAAAVTVGGTLFRSASAARVLYWGVVASASAVGVAGLANVLRSERSLAGWTAGEMEVFAAPFGPFVNPNNAAALLVVGLAAAAALLATCVGDRREGEESRAGEAALSAAAAVLLTASLIAAGSRSGVACGGLAAAAAVLLARPLRATTLAVAALTAAGLLYAATRVADVSWIAEAWRRSDRIAEDARFTHGREMLEAVRERPLFGWGPNTYGMVSRKFVTSDGRLWFEHADSQWFETLVDGGVVGLAVALAFAGCLAWGVRRRREDPAARLPVAAAGGVLAGLAAHSLFDNAVLASGVWVPACLVLGSGSLRRPSGGWAALGVVAAAAAGVGAWELHSAARVQKVAVAVPDLRDQRSASEQTVLALLERNAAALDLRPDDSLGHWTEARLNTYLARLRLSAAPPPPVARRFRTTVWPLFEPARLHAVAAGLPAAELEELRADAAVGGPLRKALEASRRALGAAPLRFRALIRAAELEWIDSPPRGLAAARRAADELPKHAPTQEAVADLAWSAGDAELLAETLPRTLALTNRYDDAWLRRMNTTLSVGEIVDGLLPADAGVLLRIAETQTTDAEDPLRVRLLRRIEEVVADSRDADLRAAVEGRLAALRGEDEAAEEVFRQRLSEQPASPATRRALAKWLLERGEDRQALIEIRAAIASDRQTPADFQLMREATARLRAAARD